MKCTNCGQEINQDWNFCPNCKTPITAKIENENHEINKQNSTKENNNAYIYITIYTVSMITFFLLGYSLFYLIALVSIIAGKIYCPKNVLIKVLFYITIILMILCIIFILWVKIKFG